MHTRMDTIITMALGGIVTLPDIRMSTRTTTPRPATSIRMHIPTNTIMTIHVMPRIRTTRKIHFPTGSS